MASIPFYPCACLWNAWYRCCYSCSFVAKKTHLRFLNGSKLNILTRLGLNRYGAYPLRGKYCHEMALRILLASIEVKLSFHRSHSHEYALVIYSDDVWIAAESGFCIMLLLCCESAVMLI